jgi:hypothetical protein
VVVSFMLLDSVFILVDIAHMSGLGGFYVMLYFDHGIYIYFGDV